MFLHSFEKCSDNAALFFCRFLFILFPFFMVFFYIIRGLATPILKNQIHGITPSGIRATVLSIRSLIIRLAFAILGPFLGWQADRAGLPGALVMGAAFFLVTGGVSAFYLIRISRKSSWNSTVLSPMDSGAVNKKNVSP